MAERLPGALRRLVTLWNGAPIDPNEVFAHDCVLNNGESTYNPEDVLPWIRKLRAAFSDIVFEVVDHVRADTRYTVFFRAHGTHTGPFETEIGTAQATGEPVAAHGIEVFDVRSDRIVGVWEAWDWRKIYATLGARIGD